MTRSKQFRNRKGRNSGCRSYLHAYTMAKLQLKYEHFMTQRAMRVYWNEPNMKIYGSLSLTSRWLRRRNQIT